MNNHNTLLDKTIDYIFWIIFILYTDPGGFIKYYIDLRISGTIKTYDILFILLSLCYFLVPKKRDSLDKDFIWFKKYLLFFLAYYFIVFGYLTPEFYGIENYSVSFCLKKSRLAIYNIMIFIYIYEYLKRRFDIFLYLLYSSSIIVSVLFVQSVITKIIIVPEEIFNREYVNINRHLLFSYGLMTLLIPIGATAIIFRSGSRYRAVFITGFVSVSVALLLTLERRSVAGILLCLLLAILINAIIRKQYILILRNFIIVAAVLSSLIAASYLLLPSYVNAARIGIKETVHIARFGTNSAGVLDQRLSLNRPFINQQFYKHIYWGSGFDNHWRGGERGEKLGFKATDYPFLSALAMFGLVGAVVFLPIYINLIRLLRNDISFLRHNISGAGSFIYTLLVSFLVYFFFDLMQYFNYYRWLSNSYYEYIWFFSLALYLSARRNYYSTIQQADIRAKVTSL